MNITTDIIIIVASAAIGFVSYKLLWADNPVEQVCEDVIKYKTGQTVDLSPDSSTTTDTKVDTTSTPES